MRKCKWSFPLVFKRFTIREALGGRLFDFERPRRGVIHLSLSLFYLCV